MSSTQPAHSRETRDFQAIPPTERPERGAAAQKRPPMIPILRLAGAVGIAIGAALAVYSLWIGDTDLRFLALAGAAGATGLFSLGFATNLIILHDIRMHLLTRDHRQTNIKP